MRKPTVSCQNGGRSREHYRWRHHPLMTSSWLAHILFNGPTPAIAFICSVLHLIIIICFLNHFPNSKVYIYRRLENVINIYGYYWNIRRWRHQQYISFWKIQPLTHLFCCISNVIIFFIFFTIFWRDVSGNF